MSEFSFDELERFSNNPNRVISKLFDAIENSIDSDTVGTINGAVDPFTFVIDAIVGTNNVYLTRLADSVSMGYPVHARTIADLSVHMSDEDWDGVFAEPSQTTLRILIPVSEIEKNAVTYEVLDNELLNFYRKLVIPKDTIVKVIDTDFWTEHAIEIRLMDHGGIQVLYDTTQTSPFRTLGTNYPEREYITLSGKKFLAVYAPVRQVSIKEVPNKASNSTVGFSLVQSYTDTLYKIRAFVQPWGSTVRYEMTVIYNRKSYDPNYPTMTIDLLADNTFRASIPTVYLENGLGLGNITLLIYTTKGVYERDITTLEEKYYIPAYYNYENTKGTLGTYELPFKTMDNIKITATAPITGGQDAKTFKELKDLIIYAHRRRDVPISNIDLSQTFTDAGYSTIKSIDFPNYRLYRVSKPIPEQETKTYEGIEPVVVNSGLGIYVGSILTSLNELDALGIGKLNDNRYTIFPKAVFDVTTTTPEIWSYTSAQALLNASAQTKIDTLKEKTLVSNPFYYVLDASNDQARIRAYYFDEPSVIEQTFFYENPYLGITLGISKSGVAITKKEDGSGFIIELVTVSSDAYKEIDDEKVGVQIAFDVNDASTRKTARGTLVGKNSDGERKWSFDLSTDWDIDHNNLIYFKGFRQFGELRDTVTAKLSQSTSFIFTYEGDSTREKSTADTKIDQSLFESQATAIVETEFKIEFGRHLEHLYTAVRPMVSYQQYEVYEQDVYQTYDEDLFKYENERLVIVDGKAVLEHAKGDVMYNDNNIPIIKYAKGTVKRDENGEVIPKGARDIRYYWDVIGFDHAYVLSQDDYDIAYYDKIKHFIGVTVMDEIDKLDTDRIERTEILYKPKSTVGFTRVIVNENQEIYIRNDFVFSVIYYLTEEGLVDTNLRSSLRINAHKKTNTTLKRNTVSRSDLINAIRPDADETSDVLDVNITMNSSGREIDVVSNIDNTNGFCVRKKLVVTGDGFLTIEEDIDVGFRQHGTSSSANTVSLEDL